MKNIGIILVLLSLFSCETKYNYIEAAEYFNIGTKKIRSLANANMNRFAITMGNRILIGRERFEEYIKSLMDGEEGE